MEARQERIDELDEQHALFALEAPAHAAALWTIDQIEAFYESEGELLGPQPQPSSKVKQTNGRRRRTNQARQARLTEDEDEDY